MSNSLDITDSGEWRNKFIKGREQFHYVFRHGMFSDVKFIVSKDEFDQVPEYILSHSLVLKVRSPVFEKLLIKMEQAKGTKIYEIFIHDFNPTLFKIFVQFLYTDELEENLSTSETLEILCMAKKYKIKELIHKCVSILKLEICSKNASSIFQVANELNEIELEQKAFKFILINASDVFQQEDFTKLTQVNISTLIQKDELEIREFELFTAIMDWARKECSRHKIQSTSKHIRLVLKGILRLIRFPLMTQEEFQLQVLPTDILDEKEIKELNRYYQADAHNKQFVIPTLFSCTPRIYITDEEQPDLTNTDEENHKRLAKFALRKFKSVEGMTGGTSNMTSVSNVILEIEIQEEQISVDLEHLQKEIFNIKKYGLYWGAVNIISGGGGGGGGQSEVDCSKKKLLISFAADEKRSYGVGSVIEEILERFPHSIKYAVAKSFKDDIQVNI